MNKSLNIFYKSNSILRQPYTKNRLKHFSEDLLAILLILITVSSLSFAAANFFCQHKPTFNAQNNNALVPAIYVHDVKTETFNL